MGGEIPKWGYAGSPLIYKDNLYIQVGEKTLLVALNKHTGKTVWESKPESSWKL
jgi:outer membrane protein assembly factor BamB